MSDTQLPQGWSEHVDPATGTHFFINEVTTQQTTVRPPNEVLPDGWTHIYYEQYQRFAYMELGTNKVVDSINDVPGYVPQQGSQQPQQQQQQQQQQQSPQSDLPKGWVENEQGGIRWYGCELTGQWIQVKPPNEVLPDGWAHVYYEQFQRFAYMKPGTDKVVDSIKDIPGHVPQQVPQEQQHQTPQVPQQAEPSGSEQKNLNDTTAPDSNKLPDAQEQQHQQQPQSSTQSDLPKGWSEVVDPASGAHFFANEATTQQTTMRPPNEVLPDGWTHIYYDEYQRFAYMNLETSEVVDSINDIPGYAPPQTSQEQQQQPSPQSGLPKGWVEKEQDGVHWYCCELTGQWTQVKPPNEVLPDGWTHVYYEQFQRFAYMELGTNKIVSSISEIPGYTPQPQEQQPQSSQTSQQAESSGSEQKNANDTNASDNDKLPESQQPPQPSPQSDLPKGWSEAVDPETGAHFFVNGATGQQTTVRPPNEDLLDGWTHVYYDEYQRFAYMNLETSEVVDSINDIPGYAPPQASQEQQQQPSPQSDLPKGWVEKEQDGIHWYCCELTGQWTQVKPPNEVLPDGWTHVYYDEYQKFAYMKLGTNEVVDSINNIPGYIPPQVPQEQQPQSSQVSQQAEPSDSEQKNANDVNASDSNKLPESQQPPQPSPQSDLPKGWSEHVEPETGAHFFVNEVTGQQTTEKPPNEVLPDGWTHVYYDEYQRFAYMNLETSEVVDSINDIPGYAPPQAAQQQSQEPQQQQQQQQPPQQQPQPSSQSDLPKGWVEKEQDGIRWYGCESTRQWTQVKPPNEVLPDGWFHVYYEQFQRFVYMELGTNKVVDSIKDIPGYIPPQVPQEQQPQPPQPSQQAESSGSEQKNANDTTASDSNKLPESQQPPQASPQSDLPKGWSEHVDPETGAHFFANGATGQQITVKPPNEVLPDGWTHIYYEQYQKFAYMKLGTNEVVDSIGDIPGCIPPKAGQQQSQESQQQQQQQPPQQQPQPPPQSDLPKGWVEKEQGCVRWYGCESTNQWTQVKPPNEVLPDGWTHVYYEQFQRFMYMELGTNRVVDSIKDIPGHVPQQVPQEQQQQPPQPSQVPQQAEPSGSEQNANDTNAPGNDKLPESQEQQHQQPPQPSPQSDLPKGWSEYVDPTTGTHFFANEVTGQQTTARPPNEALPDSWTHIYYDEYQKFGYMKLGTNEVVDSINDIPGYVPPQVPQEQQQQQQQPSQPPPQGDLPKGWVEKEQNGIRWYGCESTRQWIQVKPPNEVLPDGWFHVYYEQFQRFMYMKLGTNRVVDSINNIPGYVPPQVQQQQPPQPSQQAEPSDSGQKNVNDDDASGTQPQSPQPPQQSDLPKGWIKKEQNGIHWYGCESTRQWIQVKPPNEVLPDGWFHTYYDQHQRFAYFNPSVNSTVWNITDIPGYVPPPVPQEQQQQPPQPSQQAEPSGSGQKNVNDDNAPDTQPQSPQPPQQSDLPKGWIEKEQDGIHWYGCESIKQWTQVKPPNEVLPDGWFHTYYDQHQRFAYFNPSVNSTVWNITDIPGYAQQQTQDPPKEVKKCVWEKMLDEDDVEYYANVETGEIKYKAPEDYFETS